MNSTPSTFANGDTVDFWQAARDGRLEFQQCASCGNIQFPPRVQCSACWHDVLSAYTCAGKGVIESVTIVERAPLPQFRHMVPYAVVAVTTVEGPRMITNLVGAGALEARIGDAVEACFETDNNANVLPQWRLCKSR